MEAFISRLRFGIGIWEDRNRLERAGVIADVVSAACIAGAQRAHELRPRRVAGGGAGQAALCAEPRVSI